MPIGKKRQSTQPSGLPTEGEPVKIIEEDDLPEWKCLTQITFHSGRKRWRWNLLRLIDGEYSVVQSGYTDHYYGEDKGESDAIRTAKHCKDTIIDQETASDTRGAVTVVMLDAAGFRDLFRSLKKRPRMLLTDERYATFVAFIVGCNAATERTLLAGFEGWLARELLGRDRSNLHWSSLIAAKSFPQWLEGDRDVGQLDEPTERQMISDLFDLLDRFLARSERQAV